MEIALMYTLQAFALVIMMIAASAVALRALYVLVHRNVDVRSARHPSPGAAARNADNDAAARVLSLAAPAERAEGEAGIRSSPPAAA